jgi:hypothetical protein
MEGTSVSTPRGAILLRSRSDHLPPALGDAFHAVRDLLTHAELIRAFVEAGESGAWAGPHVAMLARNMRDGRAKAERAVAAVRDDLNRTRGVPGEAAVFGGIYAENALVAALRFVACLDKELDPELTRYGLDGSDEIRWAADAKKLRTWFAEMPAGNAILAAVELEASQAAAASSALGRVLPKEPPSPKRLLTSWSEILQALDMKSRDRDKIIRLNKTYEGPIQLGTRGGQPLVERDKLLIWWDTLTLQHADRSRQRQGARTAGPGSASRSQPGPRRRGPKTSGWPARATGTPAGPSRGAKSSHLRRTHPEN